MYIPVKSQEWATLHLQSYLYWIAHLSVFMCFFVVQSEDQIHHSAVPNKSRISVLQTVAHHITKSKWRHRFSMLQCTTGLHENLLRIFLILNKGQVVVLIMVLCGVPNLHLSVPTKSGQKKGNQWEGHGCSRLSDACGGIKPSSFSLIPQRAPILKIAEKKYMLTVMVRCRNCITVCCI